MSVQSSTNLQVSGGQLQTPPAAGSNPNNSVPDLAVLEGSAYQLKVLEMQMKLAQLKLKLAEVEAENRTISSRIEEKAIVSASTEKMAAIPSLIFNVNQQNHGSGKQTNIVGTIAGNVNSN